LHGGPGLPLLLPDAEVLASLRGERRPARLPNPGGGCLHPADGNPPRPPGHPDSRPDVMRAAIAVTIGYDDRRAGLHLLRQDYIRSVEQAGGLPLVIAPGRPADAPELLDRVQGLLLTGGSDVDPALYGASPHPKLGRVVRERDDFELALAREALER